MKLVCRHQHHDWMFRVTFLGLVFTIKIMLFSKIKLLKNKKLHKLLILWRIYLLKMNLRKLGRIYGIIMRRLYLFDPSFFHILSPWFFWLLVSHLLFIGNKCDYTFVIEERMIMVLINGMQRVLPVIFTSKIEERLLIMKVVSFKTLGMWCVQQICSRVIHVRVGNWFGCKTYSILYLFCFCVSSQIPTKNRNFLPSCISMCISVCLCAYVHVCMCVHVASMTYPYLEILVIGISTYPYFI